MEDFEVMGFPQVIGAVDGCHCNIISPVHQAGQFINRKQRYSMHGKCDHTGRFVDLVMGCLIAPLEVAEENVNSVIAACVILHNIVETDSEVLLSRQPRPAVYTVDEAQETDE
ncbi:hypothetical protein JD844_032694 [Phrynosoma platyrhinos]|uniref:DDE Tnp4 domain-containing protein n=1 Tax=Phrynosoma platyrhinos TaxID=52577 RepID=A0ABQ7T5V0_PHRPL|nr:hypothetical protein JD844_032694 [Phrynosoma platyrhinos]